MANIQEIADAVSAGRLKKIDGIVQSALDDGADPGEIMSAMIDVMGAIGDKFQSGEIFIPEMMVAALTMKKGVAVLKPALVNAENVAQHGTFIIGTVEGDNHDIGKNLVAMMVESVGFEVVDLGVDVSPEKFVDAIKAHPDCKLVGLSALLTTTMESMRRTVQAISEAGLRDQVKIMVGGAPVTPEFAAEIGADIYTADAGAAAAKAKELA